MNEVIIIFTIDILFNLTPESQPLHAIDILGYTFVGIIFINLSIHMFFIVRGGFTDVKRSLKNKNYLRRYKKWHAALSDDKKEDYPTVNEVKEKMLE